MAEEPEVHEGSRKKSKLLFFIILGVVVLLAGGGGFFAYTKLLASHKSAKHAAVHAAPPKIIGELFSLDPFVVNLADPSGKRYLKVQIQLEMETKEAVGRATLATPKLRDMVIMMLTSLTFDDVMTPEGKIRIRDELLQRFNQVMRPDRVVNIYFTEFVVQ
ncbi:MAG: flagellar basal body-associated FliL family protein [Desulfobacteraceae bacterium]|nr:flagellar basal body-associated FliL family protein [Desulfobacteraceae bacterium]